MYSSKFISSLFLKAIFNILNNCSCDSTLSSNLSSTISILSFICVEASFLCKGTYDKTTLTSSFLIFPVELKSYKLKINFAKESNDSSWENKLCIPLTNSLRLNEPSLSLSKYANIRSEIIPGKS